MQLAQHAPNEIGVQAVTDQVLSGLPAMTQAEIPLSVLTPPFIARGYRLTSFSSLNHSTKAHHQAQDESIEIKDDEGKPLFIDHEEDSAFARFNFAGKTVLAKNAVIVCIKYLNMPTLLNPWVSAWKYHQQLKAYGIVATWQSEVIQWLSEVMVAPLSPTLTLQQLGRDKTLRELDFHLPLTRFYPPTLMECLRQHGEKTLKPSNK